MVDGTFFGEQGLDLEYTRIVIWIIKVRRKLARLLQEERCSPRTFNSSASMINELIEEADVIDSSLQDYSALLPKILLDGQHPLPEPHPWPMRDFYTPEVRIYSSPGQAAIWCNYFATRILINSTKLKLLELGEPCKSIDKQRVEALYRIQFMANELASSIPFCLERFKITRCSDTESEKPTITLNISEDVTPCMATLLVWPLTLAASVGGVHASQQKWFRSELARIGRIVGYGVIECAETDQWPVNHLNLDRVDVVGAF